MFGELIGESFEEQALNDKRRFLQRPNPTVGEIAGVQAERSFTDPLSRSGLRETEIIAKTEGQELSAFQNFGLAVGEIFSNPFDGGTTDVVRHMVNMFAPDVPSERMENSGYNVKITEEQWKSSPHYREEINYHPNMNEAYAKVLAERHDREKRQIDIIENQEGLIENAVGLLSGIGAGVVEPNNLLAGVAGAGAVGAGIKTLQVAGKVIPQTFQQGIGRIGVEGVVSAAPLEVIANQNARITGEDYDYMDSAMNLMASVLLSSAIHGGVKVYEAKVLKNRELEARQVFDHALAEGRDPQDAVNVFAKIKSAETFVPLSTIGNRADAEINIVKKGNTYYADYKDEGGILAGAKGKGKTEAEAKADLDRYYTGENNLQSSDITEGYLATLRQIKELEEKLPEMNRWRGKIWRDEAKARDIPIEEIEKARTAMRGFEEELRVSEMEIEEFPNNKKILKKYNAVKRKYENAKQVIDDYGKFHTKNLQKLDNDVRDLLNKTKSDLDSLKKQAVSHQMKNAKEAMVSHFMQDKVLGRSPTPEPRNAVDTKAMDNPDVAIDEAIESAKTQGVSEDVIAKYQEDLNENIKVSEQLERGINCLKG